MSPIEGISDIRHYPRLGKIRTGEKAEGQRGPYPKALDYFKVPEEVAEVHGEKPTELPIMLPSDDLELVAPQWLKCYSYTQGLICKGNGKTCRRKVDVDTGDFADKNTREWQMADGICDPEHCPKIGDKQCRRMMSLLFILPEVPGLGVYQLDTSSFYSIVNLNSQLAPDGFLRHFTNGRIAFIPLILSLEPREVTPPGVGRKTVHVLNVRADVKLADIIRISRQKPTQVLLGPVDDEEIPADFYPDEIIDSEAETAAVVPEPETPEPAAGDFVGDKTPVTQHEQGQPAPAQAAVGKRKTATRATKTAVSGTPTPDAAAERHFTPPDTTMGPVCHCNIPLVVGSWYEKEDGTCWHAECGGYLCTPPIDCHPGCPHMPLGEAWGEPPPGGDEKIGGDATVKPGGEGQPAPTILSSPEGKKTPKTAERAPRAAPPLGDFVGDGVAINLDDVHQLFKSIKWNDETAKTWLASHLQVNAQGSFEEVVRRLNRAQAETFVKELQNRAAKVPPSLFD